MNFIRMLFAALLGLFSTSILVSALESTKEQVNGTENTKKQYIITLRDEISRNEFIEVSNWIKENEGQIVESINENFAKLIIAKADPSITKLAELKPELVESVDEDDLELSFDDHVDL